MKSSSLYSGAGHIAGQRLANCVNRHASQQQPNHDHLRHVQSLLVFILLLLQAVPVYSDELDEKWHALEFGDVVMYTDLETSDAQALAQHVVEFRAVLDQALPQALKPLADAPKLRLLVFKRRADFAKLMKPQHFAAFTQSSLKETLLVIAPSKTRSTLFSNTRHELVHYQLRNQNVGFPPWYDEGVAVMLEHTTLQSSSGSVALTSDLESLYGMYRGPIERLGFGDLRQLTEATDFRRWPHQKLTWFYGLSGQFVHYLTSAHNDELKEFLQHQDQGLAAALGRPLFRVEKDFSRHRKSREQAPWFSSAPLENVEVYRRAMRASEVTLVHARAAENANPRRAIRLYRSIVAKHPDRAAARINLARGYIAHRDYDNASKALDAASRLLDSPSAQYLVLRAMLKLRDCGSMGSGECRDVWSATSKLLRQALDVDPGELEGIFLLGVVDLYRGRPGSALNYLRAIHRYVPWAPRVNYHLGECLRILGDPTAVIYLRNALAWSHDEEWVNLSEASLKLLEETGS